MTALVAFSLGLVDQARDLLAVVQHGAGEGEALGLDRLDRLSVARPTSPVNSWLLLLSAASSVLELLVEHARHLGWRAR